MRARDAALGSGAVLMLLALFSGNSPSTTPTQVHTYDPREMRQMLGDQEELKARLSELRRELGGIAKAAAPKIEPERPSPTLAPP